MPRRARLALPGVPRHVIQRGNNRLPTFFADEDYQTYLRCLAEVSRKYGCAIYAYVLMTNHVHLLASEPQPLGISRMMQHIGRRYVQHINFTYRRSGTLWEGRFKASLVDTEVYFLRCSRYIECNPVRAQMVQTPGGYPWSSYRAHAFGESNSLLSEHQQYRALGITLAECQAAYRTLFRTELDSAALAEIRDSTNRGWPLGSERFKDEIARTLLRATRPPQRGRPPKSSVESTMRDLFAEEM
jgi:putative transposase